MTALQDYDAAGRAEAFQYTALGSGAVNRLTIYIDSGNTATQVIAGLYSDTGANNPNILLTQGVITNPAKGAWNSVAVPAANITTGTKYWIAILSPTGAGTVRFRDVSSGAKSQLCSQSNLSALPTTWKPGQSGKRSPMSAYATGN